MFTVHSFPNLELGIEPGHVHKLHSTFFIKIFMKDFPVFKSTADSSAQSPVQDPVNKRTSGALRKVPNIHLCYGFNEIDTNGAV